MFDKLTTRIKKQGILSTFSYLFFTVFLEKMGFEIIRLYVIKASNSTTKINEVKTFLPTDDIPSRYLEQLTAKCGNDYKNHIINKRKAGAILALGIINDSVAGIAWLANIQSPNTKHKDLYWIIHACLTFPEFRGKNLYPKMIRSLCQHIAHKESKQTNVYIESSIANKASINGIIKCGFSSSGFAIYIKNKIIINKYKING